MYSALILFACMFGYDYDHIRAEPPPHVEFDCSPIPNKGKWELIISVETEKMIYEYKSKATNGDKADSLAESFAAGLKSKGFKVEVVDEVKVRVYGQTVDGKFYPAIKGNAESKELKKESLPKVTVVGKKI